jgi:DNA-binding CsgD family transcriptional regulator
MQNSVIDRFFTSKISDEHISEEDYERVAPMISTLDTFSRLTYQSVYVIDFYKKRLPYVSKNPFFLDGLLPDEVMNMGMKFHLDRVLDSEVNALLEINQAGFEFLAKIPVEDRLKVLFSCYLHIRNGNRTVLVNHKSAPMALSPDGNLWLTCCTVSLASKKEFDHAEARIAGKDGYWTYSLQSHQWTKKDGIALNNREKEILLLSAQGYTMSEITEHLHIGVDAIKSHKQKLFKKLGANNMPEALSIIISYQML